MRVLLDNLKENNRWNNKEHLISVIFSDFAISRPQTHF